MTIKQKIRCPYYKKCKRFNKQFHICTFGEGYFGDKFKADTCLK